MRAAFPSPGHAERVLLHVLLLESRDENMSVRDERFARHDAETHQASGIHARWARLVKVYAPGTNVATTHVECERCQNVCAHRFALATLLLFARNVLANSA